MAADTVTSKEPFHWNLATIKRLLSSSWDGWNNDEATRMGAALAYYTILSAAPLLLIIITIAGFAFGKEAVQGQLMDQISGLVGQQGASAIQMMLKNAALQKGTGLFASGLGLITLLFGASSVVGELRSDLDKIWRVKEPTGFKGLIKERSYAFAVIIAGGFLLLVSLVISTGITAAETFLASYLPLSGVLLQVANIVVSFAVITCVFAFMFKFLPSAEVKWPDVWLGAAFTSILFTIGKYLIGMYLGRASFGSTFGAAGSLVIVLVWVYYSAQIFFFGAEFTRHYAVIHGDAPLPEEENKASQQSPVPSGSTSKPVANVSNRVSSSYPARVASGNSGLPPMTTRVAGEQQPSRVLASAGALVGVALAIGRIGRFFRREGQE